MGIIMRICMINEVANQAFHLSQGLAKAGHQVKVLLHESKKANTSFLFNQRKIPNVDVCWITGRAPKIQGFRIAIPLLREIIRFRPHIIHAQFLRTQALIATVAALFLRVPIVGVAHGSDIRGSRPQFLRSALLRLFGHRIDKVILTAKTLEKEAFMFPREKVVYIPRIIDTDFFKPKEARSKLLEKYGRRVVLSVGRLIPIKTPEKLIRAFQQVVEEVPKAKLLMLGIGHLKSELIRLRDALGLTDNVEFLGKIPNIDLPEYYNLAKIESHGFRRSVLSLGIAHLEALSSGTPIVTHIGKKTLPGVISSYSENEITEALVRLLTNEPQASKIGTKGRQYVIENFSIKSVTEKTLHLYSILLSRRP